jgi:hypothetical protein
VHTVRCRGDRVGNAHAPVAGGSYAEVTLAVRAHITRIAACIYALLVTASDFYP